MKSDDQCGWENGEVVPIEATEEELSAAELLLHDEKINSFAANVVDILPVDAEQIAAIKGLAFLAASDMVRRVLMEIVDSDRPKFTCDILACAWGIRLRQGLSKIDVARRHGVSKQDINNSEKRLLKKLGVKQVVTRSSHKPDKFSKTNHRHGHKDW